MHRCARAQERADIGLRRFREPVAGHGRSGPGLITDARQPAFQRFVVDLLVVAAFEIGDALIDALAEPLQLQRIDLATVLQGADRVADRLAGVAVFTLVQNLVDEGVLFGRETDVAGGYGAPPDLQ